MGYAVKNCGLEIKDVDTERGIVSGYFSAFDLQDSDEDIITKGAYSKTIAENGPGSAHPRIKHFLDHSTQKAVGVLQSLEEDGIGLAYVSKTGRHTLGRDYLLMCQDGIITEHSVGFDTIKSIPNPKSESGYGRIITEIHLWEGSGLQAWGANMFTPLTSAKLKSFTDADHSSRTRLLQELTARQMTLTKAARGAYTDETAELLEIQAAQIDALCKTLAAEPSPSLTEDPKPAIAATSQEQEPPLPAADLLAEFKKSLSFLN